MLDCEVCGNRLSAKVIYDKDSMWYECCHCGSDYLDAEMVVFNNAIRKLEKKGIVVSFSVKVEKGNRL